MSLRRRIYNVLFLIGLFAAPIGAVQVPTPDLDKLTENSTLMVPLGVVATRVLHHIRPESLVSQRVQVGSRDSRLVEMLEDFAR